MPAKWKDILSNSTLYPDDFAVALKDGQTLTFGEMRAYDRENEGALTQRLTTREQEIAKRESTLNTASIEFGKVVERVADQAGLTVDELLGGKAPTKRTVAAATNMDEDDPLVGSLVKDIKSLRAEVQSVRDEGKKLRSDALGPMLNTYLEDHYENVWDQRVAPTLPKGATVTRDEALKYASDNGLKDKKGRWDLAKAARDLTYDQRVAEEADRRLADLRKKDSDERVIAAAPKPSGTHINVKPDKSLLNQKGQVKSIDEALLDAANDAELWRGIGVGQA